MRERDGPTLDSLADSREAEQCARELGMHECVTICVPHVPCQLMLFKTRSVGGRIPAKSFVLIMSNLSQERGLKTQDFNDSMRCRVEFVFRLGRSNEQKILESSCTSFPYVLLYSATM